MSATSIRMCARGVPRFSNEGLLLEEGWRPIDVDDPSVRPALLKHHRFATVHPSDRGLLADHGLGITEEGVIFELPVETPVDAPVVDASEVLEEVSDASVSDGEPPAPSTTPAPGDEPVTKGKRKR